MEFADVLRRRRMVRNFSGEPIAPELLERVLGSALRAPSAGNAQGWDAVVMVGAEETSRFWDSTTTPDWRATSPRWPGLRRAPVVIALFADPDAYLARYAEPDKAAAGLGGAPAAWPVPYWTFDAGQAVLLMLLSAVDAGLGACFLGNFRGEAELRRAVGVPESRTYVGAVLLGGPADGDPPSTSARRRRRTAGDVFHRGGW